jgi:hypothetical protein
VLNRLEHANSMQEFEFATLHEMMVLLESAQSRHALGA